jgi:dTDP-4-dehydrorhamnose 3,5-epimerase-like enzyme
MTHTIGHSASSGPATPGRLVSSGQAIPLSALRSTGIAAVRFLDFRTIHDPSGNLTPIEESLDVPFDIKRVFFLYDVPGGAERGGHAHRTLEEVVIAISGSFDVVTEDGIAHARYSLNRAYYGLYLPAMVWMNLENFSSNAVALVLASQPFDEADYFRERTDYLKVVRGGSTVGGGSTTREGLATTPTARDSTGHA